MPDLQQQGTASPTNLLLTRLKAKLQDRFSAHLFDLIDTRTLGTDVTLVDRARLKSRLERVAEKTLKHTWRKELTAKQREQLVTEWLEETLGLGPLEPLLKDPSVSEIMVNGPSQIFVERRGRLERTPLAFRSRDHLLAIVEKILSDVGRRVSVAEPYVDARMANGSRVTVAIPPISLEGPCMTIRKFFHELLSFDELVRLGTLSPQAAQFLQLCVRGRLNLVVSGPASSGKTTLMNALAWTIPAEERAVVIEETAELQLPKRLEVRLETRPANVEGRGKVTIRDLLKSALHMRPDRILVGEVRGEEALDMLQALNTGHDGSMTTLHANTSRDVLDRIATMVLMSRVELSPVALERQMRAAIDLIVHLERFGDGSRKVTQVSEVRKDPSDGPLSDLFVFTRHGPDEPGLLLPTGARPAFLERLKLRGVEIPDQLFVENKPGPFFRSMFGSL